MSEKDDLTPGIIRPRPDISHVPPGPGALRPPVRVKPPPLPSVEERTASNRSVAGANLESESAAAGPTVGWLVIMAGPGRGRSLTLGAGMNHLGRSTTNRLVLDFGDSEISFKAHATITYDPRGKKFYVQPGPDAVNLTYLGEEGSAQPVLTPIEITGGEMISLGKTRLKFVSFCGPGFSWE